MAFDNGNDVDLSSALKFKFSMLENKPSKYA
jgi:hypothetical protein